MDYTLHQKQAAFSRLITELIEWAYREGYEITQGEGYRTQEQADWNSKHGIGISNSLHTLRLAHDYNFFKDGQFLTIVDQYKEAGEYWESLSTPGLECCWGGRFFKPDADHFSISHNGIR